MRSGKLMENFELDHRLAADCVVLGELKFSLVLLVKNALLPWFILVPRTTQAELIDLTKAEQDLVYQETLFVSEFVRRNFEITKLNVGAIGNIVRQMHIHVVGRHESDFCWPGVVWGRSEKEAYAPERIEEIRRLFETARSDS